MTTPFSGLLPATADAISATRRVTPRGRLRPARQGTPGFSAHQALPADQTSLIRVVPDTTVSGVCPFPCQNGIRYPAANCRNSRAVYDVSPIISRSTAEVNAPRGQGFFPRGQLRRSSRPLCRVITDTRGITRSRRQGVSTGHSLGPLDEVAGWMPVSRRFQHAHTTGDTGTLRTAVDRAPTPGRPTRPSTEQAAKTSQWSHGAAFGTGRHWLIRHPQGLATLASAGPRSRRCDPGHRPT